jgi:hypothetical protein
LIEVLDEQQQRRPPYPITWSEQADLMEHLPTHPQRMALFALNRGSRDDNVCKVSIGLLARVRVGQSSVGADSQPSP